MSSVDFAALRRRFSGLSDGRAYLATQCLGPLPDDAFADLDEYRRTLTLRKRGLGAWIERLEEHTVEIEQLLGAPSSSVALFSSATSAQGAFAATQTPTGRRNRILCTGSDFHSTRYLWNGQSARGFETIEVAPRSGAVPVDRLIESLDERVAIVALALVSPRTGALADMAPLVRAAHDAGALVVVDAYQAVGVVPIDVRALDVDVLVGGTHKWLCGGGTGLAFLYVRPTLAESLTPAFPGWIGHREMLGFAERYAPAPGARRLQQGTPALEPVYTARAGLRFVLDAGVDAIRARNLVLTDRLLDRAAHHGLPVTTPRPVSQRGGMICFSVDPAIAEAAVNRLEAAGIDVDQRPGAGVRIAPHACNTEEECDRAVDALAIAVRELTS